MNGLTGTVDHWRDDAIFVRFPLLGQIHKISGYTFEIYSPVTKSVLAWRQQFPIMLAFALTIHKSQGMTLDAEVNCRDIFLPGQLAVAIGRARSRRID